MFSWLFSDPLLTGTPAPDFSLPDDSGRTVTSVVLVFYPGDDTLGCTKQLCEFRDSWDRARSRNVAVFGVNPQSAQSHTRFRHKFRFPFPILVDRGQKVAGLYHANGVIVKRTVYLLGPDGVIRFSRRGKPSPAEVLALA